MPISKNKGAI